MKYKKYPSYKDSGVDWLGEIPKYWDCTHIGVLFDIKAGGDVKKEFFSEEKNNEFKYPIYTNTTVTTKVYGYSNRAFFKENTITVTGRGDIGFAVYRDHKFDAIIRLLVLSPRNKENCKYFMYYINSVLNFNEGSSAINQLSTEQIKPYKVLIPTKLEQQQIATFLDNATAKIDTLIEKQTKQIELLKEKRQAVISHAVTKGINPNVPMKDSGVEWLGVIPEHWGTSPLKFLISEPLMYGANESADRDNPNDPRYIRITDIKKDGTLHEHTFKSLPIEIAKPYLLKENSLLLTRTGATVGKSFLYEISWGVACFAGYLIKAVISPNKALSKYVYYFTNTPNYWQWLKSSQIQATIENVSAEKYSSLSLPVPSLAEQRQIVEYIDEKTSKIDILIEKSNKSIELLKEKRTALISAAVTGKIDVREFE